ncbi:MAG TPA: helix-turn-helix domain-containing protein [Bryobacteraceae bacterium]|nr:helix-turn-helix domain-containing protein [Bryobacteraceae bacterium]
MNAIQSRITPRSGGSEERPLTVRDAALFLGVSPQTVYLWVERKQIPHLRVMGRNIRFLKSDLEPFRATFKQEVGYGTTVKHDGGLYKRPESKIWWMQYRNKTGERQRESTGTEDWDEAQRILRERLQARDNNTLPSMRRGRELTFGARNSSQRIHAPVWSFQHGSMDCFDRTIWGGPNNRRSSPTRPNT